MTSRHTRSLFHLPAVLLAVSLCCGDATADEVRLLDGRVLVGKVAKKQATLEITTRDGVVSVPENEVKEHLTDDQLRVKLNDLARRSEDTTFGHLQLAMQARAVGLEPEMWRHLDRALGLRATTATSEGLQRRLADFLGGLEPEVLDRRWRGATTKARVNQLLSALHSATNPGRLAATEELLVREPNADVELRLQARRNTGTRQRIVALGALQRRALAGNDRFVLRTAILDGSEAVRTAAIDYSRRSVSADDVAYLATGLAHQNAKVRVRTAEALGGLGHADATKLLVLAGPSAGTGLAGGSGGVRAHIAIMQQQAYIRDYDVEVAQAAFIADPKVDVLQSGSVLDVNVAGTIEIRTIIRAYRSALKQLTQNDPGDDIRKWPDWLAQVQPAASPAAPTPTATPAPTTPKR
jgi:hypothetical protein